MEIDDEAFRKSRLDRVVFSDGIKRIGERAFDECFGLNDVFFPPEWYHGGFPILPPGLTVCRDAFGWWDGCTQPVNVLLSCLRDRQIARVFDALRTIPCLIRVVFLMLTGIFAASRSLKRMWKCASGMMDRTETARKQVSGFPAASLRRRWAG